MQQGGTVCMEVAVGSKRQSIRLDNALFSPDAPINLVSEGRARECGIFFNN